VGRVRLISRQSSDDINVRIVEICQPLSILLEYYYYAKVFRRLVTAYTAERQAACGVKGG